MEKRFISPKEAAQFLGLSRPTIDRLVKRRAIPSYMIGHRRLFDPEELVEWVKRHRDDKPKRKARKKGAIWPGLKREKMI
jgi:excisionase family DNA binding protein